MKSDLKKALILSGIGFVIGLLIGLTIFYITELKGGINAGAKEGSIFELLLGGIYGAMAMGMVVVYDIESWSITRATLTHFLCTFGGFHALALVQGWFYPGDKWYVIITIIWIALYIIIWLANYLTYLHKVRQMNDKLKNIR